MSEIQRDTQPMKNNNSKRIKIPFSAQEDKIINNLVNMIGNKQWSFIAKFVAGRTAKQCRDRYTNYLKPGLSNIEWTEEEDKLLLKLYQEVGPKWSTMHEYFKNRNQISLKNRFLYLQKNNDCEKEDDILNSETVDSHHDRDVNDKNQNVTLKNSFLLNNQSTIAKKDQQEDEELINKIFNDTMNLGQENGIYDVDNMYEFDDNISSFTLFNDENDFYI
ncbi:hypothetical protein M9Y10_039028 [Tritrichomonas musculus]|uniref:Myb-like DNA-binding domain containing protein n=1 Tax=Tritrichomonas musculus TaxID=1915356 RepID=A0ABR2KA19_9EUKA